MSKRWWTKVDWRMVALAAALAGVLRVLADLAGLPGLEEG